MHLLKELFNNILIPKQVYDELTTPDSYWLVKKNVKLLKKEEFIKIIPIETNYITLKEYKSMLNGEYGKPIGKGEAAALTLAMSNNGIIASNNLKDIKKIAEIKNIPIITSSIILTALYEKRILSESETENIWMEMINKKTKLPEKKFKDYYKNRFKKDLTDFKIKKYYRKLIQTE